MKERPSEGSNPVIPIDLSAETRELLADLTAERDRLKRQLDERSRELAAHAHALAESEARFRDVIQRNADAIVVVDRQGRIRFANGVAARLFNADGDLLGTEFGFPVVAGETTELDLVAGGDPRVVEMRVVSSEWEGQPALIASLRDITERKRAEEATVRLAKEQAARVAAENLARRFRFLAECGAVLSSSLNYTTTLSEIARLCGAQLADWVIVYVVDAEGVIQRLEITHRDPTKAGVIEKLRRYPLKGAALAPVAEVIRSGEPLIQTQVTAEQVKGFAQDEQHLALLREAGIASFMLIPLNARHRAVGAIALISADPDRPFTDDDIALANDLAARAALAVDNARLYEEAKAANKTKTDFLALISHDLRTPLNSIIGYAELMSMGIPEPISDGSRERLGRIRTSARHLLYLMDELLAFARLDSHHDELALTETVLDDLVREVATMLEPLAHEKNLDLRIRVPDQPVEVLTDANKLRQVLMNLVSNAVKYTEQGAITVTLEAASDEFVLEVEDTGAGIAAENLGRIFDPFWQADPAQRTRGGGTGLGLSIVKRIVVLLGGTIEVASEVGRGSTFTVRVPRGERGVQGRRRAEEDAS